MHQVTRRHAVYRHAGVLEPEAPDAELGIEVVGRRRRRQRVQGAHRIIEGHAAERLKLAGVQGGAGRRRLGFGSGAARHGQLLLERTGAFGQGDLD